jgi:hypothetical protein
MTRSKELVTVDLKGLAMLSGPDQKAKLVLELLQNALDESPTEVEIEFFKAVGKPQARIVITDNGPGFKDLADAYTLFAPSYKKDNAQKRGRFNMGEKQVLAISKELCIHTTTGTVTFNHEGRKVSKRKKRHSGTEVSAVLKLTTEEYDKALGYLLLSIIPPMTKVVLNGTTLPHAKPVHTFQMTLPTIISNDEGTLVSSKRKTFVHLYETGEEPAYIYEMGLPVQQLLLGDKFHIDVQQRIPVSMDRSVVKESYIKKVRTEILNHVHATLDGEEVNESWVTQALNSKDLAAEALGSVIKHTYGDNFVSRSLKDKEANHRAVASGYGIIEGRSLPKEAWEVARQEGLIENAGDKFSTLPSRIVPSVVLGFEEMDDVMEAACKFSKVIAKRLLGIDITAKVYEAEDSALANYGGRVLRFNYTHLKGTEYLEAGRTFSSKMLSLIIHELAHEAESNHLSKRFNDAMSDLGADMTLLGLSEPQLFEVERYL